MPLDDRSVYRAVVVRRGGGRKATAARVQPWRAFCRLPYDYTK
jgi:hypothetical protein